MVNLKKFRNMPCTFILVTMHDFFEYLIAFSLGTVIRPTTRLNASFIDSPKYELFIKSISAYCVGCMKSSCSKIIKDGLEGARISVEEVFIAYCIKVAVCGRQISQTRLAD